MVSVSALGAVVALSVAIFLILKKVPPAYGMIAGALIGGLIGGADLAATVKLMIEGAQGDYHCGDADFGRRCVGGGID